MGPAICAILLFEDLNSKIAEIAKYHASKVAK